jgi:hypothetical protein
MPEPNDADIGCAYDHQSSPACPGYDAGAHVSAEASAPSHGAEGGEAGEGGEGGGMGEGGGGASGLGQACTGQADCSGLSADYCLVSPNGGFKSFCTFRSCTAAVCGSAYKCCDCTKSSVSLVNMFPAGICVLPMTASALPAFGCTCAN